MDSQPPAAPAGLTIRLAEPRDIPALMDLESRHYIGNLDASQRADGYISVLHPQQWFAWAVGLGGLHLAVADDGSVAGFIAITPPLASQAADTANPSPIVAALIELATTVEFGGRTIAEQRWALRGPVLIDGPARGRGLYAAFNATAHEAYRDRYDVGVLFVAADNPRSLHTTTTKLQAQPLAEFPVGDERYHLLAFAF